MKATSKITPILLALAAPVLAQTPNWTLQNPTVSPASRDHHGMVYETARNRTILFGGLVSGTPVGDTWSYDGTTWTALSPATAPSARSLHSMVYDSLRRVVVLFGGQDGTSKVLRDTWLFDGVNWTKIPIPPTGKPSARLGTAMTFDSARGVAVLFGGYDSRLGLVNDTWEWNGIAWARRTPTNSPPVRHYHKLAYDAARQRVVLFGGDVQPLDNDTWEYDGTTWTEVKPNTVPKPSHSHAMAYDGARRRILLNGGDNAPTFEWDGRNWTQINTANAPAKKHEAALVYDSGRQRMVMFGGSAGGSETWEYYGSGCALSVDVDSISTATGGTQELNIDAGPGHAGRGYWVFGSVTGTSPGVTLLGVTIPLNPDLYTNFTIGNPLTPPLWNFRGTLGVNGKAAGKFTLPPNVVNAAFTLHHAFVVFDASGRFFCASNATPLEFK